MSKQYTKLYVLMLDGVILTPDSFQEYWKNYGTTGSSLYGWRPPKKIYYTLGHARNGLRFVPEQIRDKVQIHVFESTEELSEINKLNNKIIDNLHRDMTVAENRGVKKGIEETEQKYKQFLDSLLDPDQYGHAVSAEVRDQVRILKGMKPVENKLPKQTIKVLEMQDKKMKLIKKGKIPACRIWRGTCSHCKSEWEALQSELSNKIESCPRERYEFAHAKCGFCGNQSLIMYPTDNYSNDTIALSNEELMLHILCPKCRGPMIKEVDKVYLTYPVKYKYVCNACNHIDYKFD